jgi:diaminohydroxyphosphoribosylaminopyrimidine deaminase/5-amino-6-(5-phosphoribosylamino)uracil reductase
VEGGRQTHEAFIAAGLYDEIRVESAPVVVSGGTEAPRLPDDVHLRQQLFYQDNILRQLVV